MLTCWRRRMILPLLVIPLLTGCQNPNNGLWIQGPTETSLPQTSQTIATLLLFSGRPNPQWVLSASQTQELLRRLEPLPLSTVEPFADGLGYQGYQVQIQSANAPLTVLRVFHQRVEVVQGDQTTYHVDAERQLERWLLLTAQPYIDKASYELGVAAMEEQPALQSNAEQSNASGIEEILVTPFITAARIFPHSWSPDSTLLAYWTFTAEEVKEDFKLPPGTLHFLNVATGRICTFPYPVGYSYLGDRIFWFATSEVFLVTDDHQVIAGDPCANNFTESTLWPEFFVHDLFRAVRAFYWKGCLAQAGFRYSTLNCAWIDIGDKFG